MADEAGKASGKAAGKATGKRPAGQVDLAAIPARLAEQTLEQVSPEARAKRPHEAFRLERRPDGRAHLTCRRCGGRAFVDREITYEAGERVELSEYSCVRCGQHAYATRPAPRDAAPTGLPRQAGR